MCRWKTSPVLKEKAVSPSQYRKEATCEHVKVTFCTVQRSHTQDLRASCRPSECISGGSRTLLALRWKQVPCGEQLSYSIKFSDDVMLHGERLNENDEDQLQGKREFHLHSTFRSSQVSSSQIYAVPCINRETLYSHPTGIPCLVLWAIGCLSSIW